VVCTIKFEDWREKIFLKLVLIWFHRPSKYPSRENILLAFDFSHVMYEYLLHISNSEFLFYLCCFSISFDFRFFSLLSLPQVVFFWPSLEIDSWTAFLVDVSGHKLKSCQTRVFVWFSTLIFPFYKMLFMNRLEFSCFADFLYGSLKPEKNMLFFKIRQKKGLLIAAKGSSLLLSSSFLLLEQFPLISLLTVFTSPLVLCFLILLCIFFVYNFTPFYFS